MKKLILGMFMSLIAINSNAALIEIFESNSNINNIAQAQSVIAASSGANTTFNSNTVWFSDVGHYGAGAFPGGHTTTFVMRATGLIDTSVYSHLRIYHDDGVDLDVNSSDLYTYNANTALRSSGAHYLGGPGSLLSLDLLFWENHGAASALLWGYNRQSGWEIAQVGDATVSEPATLALFGLGLIGLGLSRRKLSA